MYFGAQGLGFRVSGSGFRAQGLGSRGSAPWFVARRLFPGPRRANNRQIFASLTNPLSWVLVKGVPREPNTP